MAGLSSECRAFQACGAPPPREAPDPGDERERDGDGGRAPSAGSPRPAFRKAHCRVVGAAAPLPRG